MAECQVSGTRGCIISAHFNGTHWWYLFLWGAEMCATSSHHLTLHHLKKEARGLLRGLQRRDPEALRRCHAIEPLTDLSNPALDHARFIIAREHGFSSWRKLKEHIENLRP